MAITDLTGTKWLFDSNPDVSLVESFSIDFVSNSISFDTLDIDDRGRLLYDGNSQVNAYEDDVWTAEAYRTIEITGGSDVTDADLIAWLEANAVQIPTDLTGTKWVLNASLGTFPGWKYYYLNFQSNNQTFSAFAFDGGDNTFLKYQADNVYRFGVGNVGWIDEDYRIIEITGGTDAASSDLISWLMANATQVPVADLTGTKWVLNSSLTLGSSNLNYDIEFESNSTNYYFLKIYDSDYDDNPPQSLAYGTDLAYYNGSWVNGASRTIEITGGTDATNATLIAWLEANAEQQVEPEPTGVKNILFGTQNIDKILFGQSEVSKIYLGQTLVYEAGSEPPTPTVDPVLGNNSWATIAQVCESGQASNYWALGDTKTDVGTDGVTRTFRICDMQGLYGKNAVFEQVELTESGIVWNPSTNTDDNGCYNNYNISDMRNTALPALLANYSLELQAVITNTTYKVAKNGTQTTVLDLIDKLFLPAEREIFASRSNSVQDEWNALTRFALYALPENDNADFRKKFKPSTPTSANYYWERSPGSGSTSYVCRVSNSGSVTYYNADNDSRVAPCFALGVAPTPAGIAVTVSNNQSATSPHIYDGADTTGTDLGTVASGETKTFYIESGYISIAHTEGVLWVFYPDNVAVVAVSEPVSLAVQQSGGSND